MLEDIYKLFLNELDFFQQHSDFVIKGPKSISSGGELVEFAIRKFFKEIIGRRFKITHGYIYSVQDFRKPLKDLI